MSPFAKSASSLSLGLLLGASLLAVNGCTKSSKMDSQAVAAYRTEFLLDDEPDDIQTVAGVRSTLLDESDAHADHDHDGDGHQDHAPGEHDAEDHAAEGHDEHAHGDEHASHDHDGDDHDGDGEGHAEHDHDAHAEHAEGDHDHDGDGHQDHAAEDHHEHAHESESQLVVMVGHIGGLANPWAGSHPDYPFAKTEATFFLADPQAVIENEEAGHKHAPGEECAFCAAHAADKADMLAVVRFVGENGEVLKTDVRDLFDVKENDTVVVQGEARVTPGGILVVDARGLYIRN